MINIEIQNDLAFILKATNGRIIATSKKYQDKKACLKAVSAIIKIIPKAKIEDQTKNDFIILKYPKFEIYKGDDKKYYFVLTNGSGQVILNSKGYTTVKTCKQGIALIKHSLMIRN